MGNGTNIEIQPVLIECRSCDGPILVAPPLAVDGDAARGQPSIRIRSRPDVPDAVAMRVDRCLACVEREAGGRLQFADYGLQAEGMRHRAGIDHAATLQLIAQWFTGGRLTKLPHETAVMLQTWTVWCHADGLISGGELLPDLPFSVWWLPGPGAGSPYALVGVAEVWSLAGVPAVLLELPALDGSGRRQSELVPAADVGTVSHSDETRLRACVALLRRSRQGRPLRSTDRSIEEVEAVARSLWHERHRWPRQLEVAGVLGVSDRTVRRVTGQDWRDFIRSLHIT